jgi:hypothetical protein
MWHLDRSDSQSDAKGRCTRDSPGNGARLLPAIDIPWVKVQFAAAAKFHPFSIYYAANSLSTARMIC